MLKVENLTFSYINDKNNSAIRDISFSACKGEFTCLLGANGSGKTTIIKCLNGIYKKNGGKIKYNNREIEQISRKQLARLISMVPQEHDTVFSYRVIDLITMGVTPYLSFGKTPARKDYERAERILTRMGIKDLARKSYNNLSGGEKQLVLIGRALMQDTDYLLLDEPTSHLDFRNRYLLLREIKTLADEGKGIIAALHDPNLALEFADKVIIIRGGSTIDRGNPENVINNQNLKCAYGEGIKVNSISGQVEVEH